MRKKESEQIEKTEQDEQEVEFTRVTQRVKERLSKLINKLSLRLNALSLIFFINSAIFSIFGVQLIKITAIAETYQNRIEQINPVYLDYISMGNIVGLVLIFYALIQLFLSAYFVFEEGLS